MANKEILLHSVARRDANEYSEIAFEISLGNDRQTLWYRVDPAYGQYLCDDRADSFIVTFFSFAMTRGLDLRSEVPVSRTLWYQLTHHIMPQLVATSGDIGQEIRIIADTTSEVYDSSRAVGTGMSCGVDSFATLYEYTELCPLPEYRITHLTHFNVGAHHGQTGYFDAELQRKLYMNDVNMVREFCERYDYKLLAVDSNLTEVLDAFFGYVNFENSHTYRNVGVVLLLQKLFSMYYYSPAYNLDQFVCKLEYDTARGEKYLLPNLGTENVRFFNSNKNWSRTDKLKQISKFPQSYDYLKVCVKSDTNCCKCVKCMRTIMGLHAIGKVDLYQKAFNPDQVRKQQEQLKTFMLCQVKKGDYFYTDIYREALANGMTFSWKSKAYSTIYRIALTLLPKKLYFKVKKRSLNKTLRVDLNEQFNEASIQRRNEKNKQKRK